MEQRLIDATKLQGEMMDMVASGLYGLEDMIDAVIEQPTVDAVPVVRCAECKNWLECLIRTDNDCERYSRCCLNGVAVGESFYCADGERRSE